MGRQVRGWGEGLRLPNKLESDCRQHTGAPLLCGLHAARPRSRPPQVLSANEHMSSGKLSVQLAASPAICCCFSSGEEQVNAMAGSQSPLPQYAHSYPSFSPSCAYPSVPRALVLWGRDNRTQLRELLGQIPLA